MREQIRQIPTNPTLTPSQTQVVAALAQGMTVAAAADAAQIHRSTVYGWLKSSQAFIDATHEAREQFNAAVREEMTTLAGAAVAALKEILEDHKAPAGSRVRAALAILQQHAVQSAPSPEPSRESSMDSTETPPVELQNEAIPRNALCPCGSGIKYKRCCGTRALPVLHPSPHLAHA